MASLRCEGLRKSFDGTRGLDNVTLHLPTSGVIAIIGPNGAGKTTLLNVLTGFLRPEVGRSFLGDIEITHLAPHQIAGLGIVRTFQELRLISQLSTLENVRLARPNQRGERLLPALLGLGVAAEEARNREHALRLLEFVGLANSSSLLADELSYGQQKLLSVACCLATDASILLLDEPIAGIHPEMVSHILCLLRQLGDDGKLVVFIEHDIAAVREIADLVVVMDQGKVIAHGSPRDVLERPEIIEAYLG